MEKLLIWGRDNVGDAQPEQLLGRVARQRAGSVVHRDEGERVVAEECCELPARNRLADDRRGEVLVDDRIDPVGARHPRPSPPRTLVVAAAPVTAGPAPRRSPASGRTLSANARRPEAG